MINKKIIPKEMKGYYTDDKMSISRAYDFQWNVRLIYIKCNMNKSLAGLEQQDGS